jgi:hypothetical protein
MSFSITAVAVWILCSGMQAEILYEQKTSRRRKLLSDTLGINQEFWVALH